MTALRIIDDHLELVNIGSNTHAQIDTGLTKLAGIEAGATADQTKADIDGLGLSHDSLSDVSANDHHNELHSIVSHNDTSATGAQLDTLTDNSIADTLHRHSELVASDGSPDPALSVDASGNASFIGEVDLKTKLTIKGADGAYPTTLLTTYSNTAWHGNFLSNRRARGTGAIPGAVISGDVVFYFDCWGYDGAAQIRGGQLRTTIDGAVAAGVVPMRWQFFTMNTSGSYAARVTLKSSGFVGIDTVDPNEALTLGNDGVLSINERTAAPSNTVAYGKLWVKIATPCELWFTDDAGNSTKIA